MQVNLTAEDWMVAATKGAIRQLQAIRKNRTGSDHGGTSFRKIGKRLGDSIIGELGEIAVSRCLGLPVRSTFEDTSASDVGNLEVRTTEYEDGSLLVHEASNDSARYVLVVITWPVARVCGWMAGKDAKRAEWWREGDPGCYFVPQGKLNDLELLKEAGQ